MPESTEQLWEKQNRAVGDRLGFFTAVRDATDARTALYPGSYADIAPSFVFDNVIYADIDRRANRFFGDIAGVNAIIEATTPDRTVAWSFQHGDYRRPRRAAPACRSSDLAVCGVCLRALH